MNKKELYVLRSTDYPVPALLDESGLAQQMRETVEPYLAAIRQSGKIHEKLPLYYELYPLAVHKGTIVICHGFTENSEKYHELIYYFLQNGYQVAIYDQRGHGKSFRELADRSVIHVRHFSQYTKDLHVFVHKIVLKKMKAEKKHLYLFGHSMGGCVSARYLEKYPEDFAKAVLSAPMMGLNLGKWPIWTAEMICILKRAMGRGTERIFNQTPFDPEESYENCSASSRARFMYFHGVRLQTPAYQVGGATYYWGQEAIRAGRLTKKRKEVRKIKTPLIMFIAGDDTLVDRRSQDQFMRNLPGGRIFLVPESRHEIYRAKNGTLKNYLGVICQFLDEN